MAFVTSAWCALDVSGGLQAKSRGDLVGREAEVGLEEGGDAAGKRIEVRVVVVRRQDRLRPADARQDVLLHERWLEGERTCGRCALGALLGGFQVSRLTAVEGVTRRSS